MKFPPISKLIVAGLLISASTLLVGCGHKVAPDPRKEAVDKLIDSIRNEIAFIRRRLGVFAATGDSKEKFDYVAFDLGGTSFAI